MVKREGGSGGDHTPRWRARIKGEAVKRGRLGPGEGRPPRLLLQPVAVIVAKTNKGGGESQERERERTVIASQSPS